MSIPGALLAALLTMSGCAADSGAAAPEPSASETVPPQGQTESTPVDSFLAWLEASRVPDVDAACDPLAPELVARMIAELSTSGMLQVETCAQMITATAELYRALGQSAEVDIAVQQETETDATLFVTYLASGDCGTVVMARTGAEWIITEQTEECAA